MKPRGPMHIFHLKLGGGERHRLAICAYAIIAAKNGLRVHDETKFSPQKGDEVPDLVISRQDQYHQGARIIKKDFKWAVEIIDSHDPVPDGKRSGYDDTLKVFLKKGDEYCEEGHNGNLLSGDVINDGPEIVRHPLCIEGLFWLCERSLP